MPHAKFTSHFKPGDRKISAAFFFAIAGTVLFSMKSIIVKLCYHRGVDTELLMAARYFISLPLYILIGFVGREKRFGRGNGNVRHILAAVVLGILGYWLSSYLDFLGLQYIDAQLERMILFTYPLMVVALGWLLFGHKPSLGALLAAVASYTGLIVIFTQSTNAGYFFWKGASFVLGSALTFALYQLCAKPIIKSLGVPTSTAVMMTSASLASIFVFFVTHRLEHFNISLSAMAFILLLSIFGTFLPSLLLNISLSRLSSQANASIGALGPVITVALAAVILHEHVDFASGCGMMLVVFGVAWFSLLETRRMQHDRDNLSPIVRAIDVPDSRTSTYQAEARLR